MCCSFRSLCCYIIFLYSNNLFTNKFIVNNVTTGLSYKENVSLQSKIAELVSNKNQIDEIALEICSGSVYNLAYSKQRILYKSDLALQKELLTVQNNIMLMIIIV